MELKEASKLRLKFNDSLKFTLSIFISEVGKITLMSRILYKEEGSGRWTYGDGWHKAVLSSLLGEDLHSHKLLV